MIWVYVHNDLTMARMSYPLQRMTPSPTKRQSEGVLLGVGAAFFAATCLSLFAFPYIHVGSAKDGGLDRSFLCSLFFV
jgi:hypothetical protein